MGEIRRGIKNQKTNHMTDTKIDYKKVFSLFVATENEVPARPELYTPFTQGEMQYATDAIAIIRLPIEKENLEFDRREKPKCEKVIPAESNCNVKIKISDLESQLVPTMIDEVIYETKEMRCRNCRGRGEAECDMGHNHECDQCDGTGTIEGEVEKPTGNKIADPDKGFSLLGVEFLYKQLNRLVTACKLMGVETVEKTYGEVSRANVFLCGDCTIVVMPALIGNDRDEETIAINL